MTPEQRFVNIETALALTVETQRLTAINLDTLRDIVAALAGTVDRSAASVDHLSATVDHYVAASDVRMAELERILAVLIRAILAEHSNGAE